MNIPDKLTPGMEIVSITDHIWNLETDVPVDEFVEVSLCLFPSEEGFLP
jgi:hypothetical protein